MFMQPLKRFVRERLEATKTRRFHAAVNARVRGYYQAIVAQDPARELKPAERKRIADYSNDVFGSGTFAPWLEVYSAYRGEFVEGWIPENYFMRVVAPSWPYFSHIDAKVITRRILAIENIPDLAYHIDGSWIDREHRPLEESGLKHRLFANADAIFVKLDRGMRAQGVRKVTRDAFEPQQLAALGNFVVQSAIGQHPFFDQFTPDSVATLRITTLKPRGQPARNRASILRLGRDGGTLVTPENAIRVPVIDDRGTLSERANDAGWASLTAHPDSHVAFSGQRIPGYEAAVAMCERLHDESPFSILIGWDIAIDRSGDPVLMEWNQRRPGIAFCEASLGPCFEGLDWENVWRAH